MRYRRAFVPGGSFFFTLVTHTRRPLFRHEDNIAVLRQAFRNVRAKRSFEIDAVVVLPDHLHCIWTLPPDDADFSTRWRLIKTWFTKHSDPALRVCTDGARFRQGEQAIWQHRFWEHALRDETDFNRHVDYIHYNPVKHGYVALAREWPYSSFHRYVRLGVLPSDRGSGELDFDGIGRE